MAMSEHTFSVLVLGVLLTLWECRAMSYVYELYARNSNTNRSVACGVCEARGGHLAIRPELDDWEILFGNLSHLDTTDFWVNLIKTKQNEWFWGDEVELNQSDISSLPMSPKFSQNYSGWNCALWNMAEPFLMPANCSITANIICQIPSSEDVCHHSLLEGKTINSSSIFNWSSSTIMDFGSCNLSCSSNPDCWAADWQISTQICRLATADSRPAVPDLIPDPDFKTLGRTCIQFREMSPEDSEFVCNCAAIELPETEEEKEQFVEDYKHEVNKDLIVPTETLSATIRKKESAPDERKSSQGIGILGITILVMVFGGLVLMDITSLVSHAKMAATNVKGVFANTEDETSDA